MTGRVLERIGAAWPSWDAPTGPPTTALFAGIDRTAEAKVSVLLFDRRHRFVGVAKVPRNDQGAAAVRVEHEALQWAAALVEFDEIPRPLGCVELDAMPVLVQTPVSGRAMTADYYAPRHVVDRRLVERDFDIAGRWLDAFTAATRQGTISLRRACEEWISPVLARFRDLFRTSPAEVRLFGEIVERCHSAAAARVPVTARHGDYWMGNIFLDRHRVTGVIDWERAARRAHPFVDLYKFPTSYGLYLDRSRPWAGGRVPGHPGREDRPGRWRQYGSWPNLIGFGHIWFGSGWLPDLARRWVAARRSALGVSEYVAGTFFPVFMMEQALALEDPVTRSGWQSSLRAFAAERTHSWLW